MFKSVFIKALFLFLSVLSIDAIAQGQRKIQHKTYRKRKTAPNISLKKVSRNELISLYVAGGLSIYNGDLSGTIKSHAYRPQIGGGIMLRTQYLDKRLNLRAEVRSFRLAGNDVYKDRNLNFRSTNWEFLALGQFDLFGYEKLMRRRPKINPYAYAGIGVMTYDPWGQLPNDKWHQLRPLQTEHVVYKNVAFVYTAGLGFKYNYNYRWNFMFEAGYRFTTTDYIDDVSSTNYPAGNSFNNSISKLMSNKSTNPNATTGRGNPKNNDGYAIVSLGITYTFTKHSTRKITTNSQLLRK